MSRDLPSAAAWRRMREDIDEEFYDYLVGAIGCGPFDGGCVIVAKALQDIFGGSIMVLTRADGCADHAVVQIGDILLDWDGPEIGGELLARFNRSEMATCTGWRAMEDSDLANAPRDARIVEGLCILVGDYLEGVGE